MDSYWNEFVNEYVNDSFYWFQPKGFTISPSNLPKLQKKLKALRSFEGEPWRSSQKRYAQKLHRMGLFQPTQTTQRSRDYAAIVRMNKEVFDSLGVAWVTDESLVKITDAGKEFLRASPKELCSFVDRQLQRYLFPNPSVGREALDAGLFPYLTLLAALTRFPQGIPSECYELFIARIRLDSEVSQAAERIRRYIRLSANDRKEVIGQLIKTPILDHGRIVVGNRRKSIFNTIRLNRSYMISFLKLPGLIGESGGRLYIDPSRHSEAEELVQSHLRKDCYIHFASPEDWIAFYGQTDKRPNYQEALEYYRRRGNVAQAEEVFSVARHKSELPKELSRLNETQFRRLNVLEKTLEDFLEFNLDSLEAGLKFVSRQYRTDSGPLDILAKDSKGGWVVIELKKGRAPDKVIGQLLRYRSFILAEKAKGKERLVRGFVVAPDPDKNLIKSAKGAKSVPISVFEFLVHGQSKKLYP